MAAPPGWEEAVQLRLTVLPLFEPDSVGVLGGKYCQTHQMW